jgi:hypothetical protein
MSAATTAKRPVPGTPLPTADDFCRLVESLHYDHRWMAAARRRGAVFWGRKPSPLAVVHLTSHSFSKGDPMSNEFARPARSRTTPGRRGAVALAATAVAAAALASSVPAYASGGTGGRHGGAVRASTICATTGLMKATAKHDALGLIELGSEVDVNVAAQAWAVKVVDNGVTVWAGRRTTIAPSGAFVVANRLPDRVGLDSITVTATRGTTVCSVGVIV